MRDGILHPSSKVDDRRSLILSALGALVGLGIAGAGLFSAHGTTTHAVPPETIALVNHRPVLRSDFVTQLEAETGDSFAHSTRSEQLKVLNEMIQEELLVQRGLELDFAETDQPTRNALATAMSQQALSDAVTSEPTPQQLREYYEQHHQKYVTEGALTVRQLAVPRRPGEQNAELSARATRVADALKSGVSTDDSIARFGLLEPRNDGRDYYFAARLHLGQELFERAVRLKAGETSDPILQDDGAHIVQVISNAMPTPLTFERTQIDVLNDYKNAQQKLLMDATMKFLRGRTAILIASDYANDYRP